MSLLRPRPQPRGDIWSVAPMSPDAWSRQPREVWRAVQEEVVRLGYPGKCQVALRLHGADGNLAGEWLTFPIAMTATELGAPIPQLFTACLLRRRAGQ